MRRRSYDLMSKLEQLDIPAGVVPGLSNTDKPTLEGLKRLRTLLPDYPSACVIWQKRA